MMTWCEKHKAHIRTKVRSIETFFSKYTRALTSEIFFFLQNFASSMLTSKPALFKLRKEVRSAIKTLTV
jgi:hypothetical protein